jgi:hypothetical protein
VKNAVHYSAIEYSASSAAQYNTDLHGTVEYNKAKHITVECTVQHEPTHTHLGEDVVDIRHESPRVP